jgi:hypothetical protein
MSVAKKSAMAYGRGEFVSPTCLIRQSPWLDDAVGRQARGCLDPEGLGFSGGRVPILSIIQEPDKNDIGNESQQDTQGP